jgi:hypothetical protein
VPSGVWAHEEYEKLRRYDKPTGEQPVGAFSCHATPEKLCHGWVVVHTSRGHAFDLLALRLLFEPVHIPAPAVPLFESGNEAADHGQKSIDRPDADALRAMGSLLRYPRIRAANDS